MSVPEHLKILKQGVESFNKWREENPEIGPNLAHADLSRAELSRAELHGAYLTRANLHGADLRGANLGYAYLVVADLSEAYLREADLRGAQLTAANLLKADLSEANLLKADLSEANLVMANLRKAHINGVNFSGAKVNEADFSFAEIVDTDFGDIDLSNVLGLESTVHRGPSTIGIDTIFRSGGKIPHKFLENAGVPDIFIEYMGSLTGQAFQFYSCFISYSNNDKEFAERIHADLRKEGVRCWFAPEDIKSGRKIHLQLDEAIRYYDKLLLILSEQSISSDWVANEIKWACKREKQDGKQKLFPVSLMDYEKIKAWELFDADTATDLAAEVRSYFIPDFTNWKDHEEGP